MQLIVYKIIFIFLQPLYFFLLDYSGLEYFYQEDVSNIIIYLFKQVNEKNYINERKGVYSIINNEKYLKAYEEANINTYYKEDNISLYHDKLALNHYDMSNKENKEYFERCIERLYDILKSEIMKYYIYINPIIGVKDNIDILIYQFDNFSKYIKTKTKNIFGIYIIIIYNNENKNIKIVEKEDYVIYQIYTKSNYIDYAHIANNEIEYNEICKIIKNILPKEEEDHYVG